MKYLVRAAPDVERAWCQLFWDASLHRLLASGVPIQTLACLVLFAMESTHSIDPSSQDVENALRDQPRQSHLALHLRNAKCLDAMENRKQGAQAHSNEHEGAERSPGWCAETGEQDNHHCRCADRCDLCWSQLSARRLSCIRYAEISGSTIRWTPLPCTRQRFCTDALDPDSNMQQIRQTKTKKLTIDQ